MRPAVVAVLLCLAAHRATHAASSTDEVSWSRPAGAAGWTTAIGRDVKPAGVSSSPLLAPRWFAKLPDATLPLADGGQFAVESARGKILLLDFWASWCGPCLLELPHLQALHVAHQDAGLLAVAVNADEDAQVATAAAKRIGLTMPIALNDAALYRTLGVRTLPSVFLADRKGRVRARWDGYKPGLERHIAARVASLLAGDESDGTRQVAQVLTGAPLLRAKWSRDLAGLAEGVIAFPAPLRGGARVMASAGGFLTSYDAQGEALGRLKSPTWMGRMLDFGVTKDGDHEIVAFRPGGTMVGITSLATGEHREIESPAPIAEAAISLPAPGGVRRVILATSQGGAIASAGDAKATLLEGTAALRAVAARPGGGVVALGPEGTVAPFEQGSSPWLSVPAGAARLFAAGDDGVAAGPRSVVAAVTGRFLPGGGRQLALATYAGHVVLLDAGDGHVLFDAVWADARDLAATDLDGDGLDELIVGAGVGLTVLGAAR